MATKVDPDDYITLTEAAADLPRRQEGRKTHVATLYRWTNAGCRGERLRHIQVGGTRCTTRRWLGEFFERLTRATGEPNHGAVATTAARQRELDRVDRKLDAIGL